MLTINSASQISKLLDHAVLMPTQTDTELKEHTLWGKTYDVKSVCIKPYAVAMAKEWLQGSTVEVCAVVGFPHGNSPISIKAAECEHVIKAGAAEVDMVVNIGKVLSHDWQYIKEELSTLQYICHTHNVLLKVIFETDYLIIDSYKIRLCEVCSEVGVAFVKTSTGFGYVKGADGKYSYQGATIHDIILMRKHSASYVGVKASGGVRTLDDVLNAVAAGATRIGVGSTSTKTIMEETIARLQKGEIKINSDILPSATLSGGAKGY
ncbi:MAG: deoxyribose-phosphate aldolase [Cytophagales bacterium]|nr:deoxyribose-phosphate aldolase [Cytophagales bacterium]